MQQIGYIGVCISMYFKLLKLLKAWTNDLGLVPKYVSLGRLYYFFRLGVFFSILLFEMDNLVLYKSIEE